MRKIILVSLLFFSAGSISCTRQDEAPSSLRIVPKIGTRVAGLYFEAGDRIGLTVVKGSEHYLSNALMTYDGTAFSASGLIWYNNLDESSTLMAYHPYSAQGMPDEFTVAADQRAGYASSDLLAAVKTDVRPASEPVGMLFYHLLSQLTLVVTNNSGASIEQITIGGFIPTAEIDFTVPAAMAKSGVPAVDVVACCVTPDASFRAILVPQQAAMTVTVATSDGRTHRKTISSAMLAGGKRYDLAVTLTKQEISLSLSGEVSDWEDGGPIEGGGGSSDGSLTYGGVTYRTKTVGGKLWMAENLRYMPSGVQLGAGVWHPADGSIVVAAQGLLYNRTTAMAGASGAGPVQGICPAGWHLPDSAELSAMMADEASKSEFLICAGYWIVRLSGDAYGPSSKGYLMSTTLSEGKMVCAGYSSTQTAATAGALAPEYGISVRCVRD